MKDYQIEDIVFYIKRGIPQGSALSGYIFILCLTPLLHLIQVNDKIEHIKFDKNYLGTNAMLSLPKVSAFADDLDVIMKINKLSNGLIPEIEELKKHF